MSKPAIMTDEKLARVPALLAQGQCVDSIATLFGCTAQSLRVTCCRKKISLRLKPRKPGGRPKTKNKKIEINLPISAMEMIAKQAIAKGTTTTAYVTRLLETIAKDNLYKAVLDD